MKCPQCQCENIDGKSPLRMWALDMEELYIDWIEDFYEMLTYSFGGVKMETEHKNIPRRPV